VDNFPFCARGVIGLSVGLSGNNLSMTQEEQQEARARVGRWYHQPNDEIYPHFRYDGLIQELEVLYYVGKYYASGGTAPSLNEDNPFGPAIRTRALKYVDKQ
jgi:hypothetical protein